MARSGGRWRNSVSAARAESASTTSKPRVRRKVRIDVRTLASSSTTRMAPPTVDKPVQGDQSELVRQPARLAVDYRSLLCARVRRTRATPIESGSPDVVFRDSGRPHAPHAGLEAQPTRT